MVCYKPVGIYIFSFNSLSFNSVFFVFSIFLLTDFFPHCGSHFSDSL